MLVGGEAANVDGLKRPLAFCKSLPARLEPRGPGNISGKIVSTVARQAIDLL
jgi:hypothetical protein